MITIAAVSCSACGKRSGVRPWYLQLQHSYGAVFFHLPAAAAALSSPTGPHQVPINPVYSVQGPHNSTQVGSGCLSSQDTAATCQLVMYGNKVSSILPEAPALWLCMNDEVGTNLCTTRLPNYCYSSCCVVCCAGHCCHPQLCSVAQHNLLLKEVFLIFAGYGAMLPPECPRWLAIWLRALSLAHLSTVISLQGNLQGCKASSMCIAEPTAGSTVLGCRHVDRDASLTASACSACSGEVLTPSTCRHTF